jgi:predicted ABC-type ATPase
MTARRVRMIAGPNGSGKSSLIRDVLSQQSLPLGRYVNADDLEAALRNNGEFGFSSLGLAVDEQVLRDFFAEHPLGRNVKSDSLVVRDSRLSIDIRERPGYIAAVLSDFVRRQWIALGESFTFETVMSSEDKVAMLRDVHQLGYRTYTYYVCTDSPAINRDRVEVRVKQGGHPVPADKINSRYHRSLSLLPTAILHSNRAYLFDNSGRAHRLIAEYESNVLVSASPSLPNWFVNSMLKPPTNA